MHFVKVTEIMKNRETREIVLNTSNIETVADGLLARITIGLGDPRELKEMRPVRCSMVSGKTVDIKFNGDAKDFGRSLHARTTTHGIGRNIPNWTWVIDDTTEPFDEVIELEEVPAPVSDLREHKWQRL